MVTAIHPKGRRRVTPLVLGLGVVVTAGLIVGYVANDGHSKALRPAVTVGATPAPSPVSEAAVALRDAIETGDPARYAAVDDALARAGDAPGTSGIRAALLLSRHQFAAARQMTTTALVKAPEDRALLGAAVDASVELGDYPAAEQYLQTLLDLRPDGRALSRVSYLRELHGDMPGALSAMRQAEQAATESSDHATISTFLGDICLATNDFACADAAYRIAQRQRPNAINPQLGRVRLLAATHHVDEAITLANQLVARSPQPAAASLVGELALTASDQLAAKNAFALVKANTQLLAAAGVVTDVEAASFEADHGDPAQAVVFAKAAYEARRTVLTADTLGWALTRAGRASEALPYVKEASALGTASVAFHTHAAAALLATGDRDGATAALSAALRSNPWTSPSARPTAIDLARQLNLDLPDWWKL